MSIGLKTAPQSPLVDTSRRITREWLQAFLVGGALSVLVDLSSDVTGTLAVGHGGTGRASLTAHDLLVGAGTSAVGLIAPGASGTILTSNGPTADPSFQAAPTSGIDQLTGDVTAGPGSGSQAATLAASGVTAGTYGDATHVAQITVDAKGRVTAASDVAISGGGASWIPVSLGVEPLTFVSDAAGHAVLVAFA